MRKNIVILTGAGISAESGLKTFRDANGLWEGHDIHEVATPEGFHKNPELVLKFYNERRQQLLSVAPNAGHQALVQLEQGYDVTIVTQNVDDLHERAGSGKIIHLHGELLKARSAVDSDYVIPWFDDIHLGDTCPKGCQMRPFIVWFGEEVTQLEPAIEAVEKADIVLIVGTSMQVYPAASLVNFAKSGTPLFYVDPAPEINYGLKAFDNLTVIENTAADALPKLVQRLLAEV